MAKANVTASKFTKEELELDQRIINEVLKALKITPYKFAKNLDLTSPMMIYLTQNMKRPLSDTLKSNIIFHFPELNPDFVRKGEGKPLKLKRKPTAEDKEAMQQLNMAELLEIYPLLKRIELQNQEILSLLKK